MLYTESLSPCHRQQVVGGGARCWCPVCGREYQADDPRLMPRAPGQETSFAEATRTDYPSAGPDEARHRDSGGLARGKYPYERVTAR